jgi:hypothetical protein
MTTEKVVEIEGGKGEKRYEEIETEKLRDREKERQRRDRRIEREE